MSLSCCVMHAQILKVMASRSFAPRFTVLVLSSTITQTHFSFSKQTPTALVMVQSLIKMCNLRISCQFQFDPVLSNFVLKTFQNIAMPTSFCQSIMQRQYKSVKLCQVSLFLPLPFFLSLSFHFFLFQFFLLHSLTPSDNTNRSFREVLLTT